MKIPTEKLQNYENVFQSEFHGCSTPWPSLLDISWGSMWLLLLNKTLQPHIIKVSIFGCSEWVLKKFTLFAHIQFMICWGDSIEYQYIWLNYRRRKAASILLSLTAPMHLQKCQSLWILWDLWGTSMCWEGLIAAVLWETKLEVMR